MTRLKFLIVILLLLFPSVLPASGGSEVRTWVDDRGEHQIQAALVDLEGDMVILSRGGKTTRVPLERLSWADRVYVEQWRKQHPAQDSARMQAPSPQRAQHDDGGQLLTDIRSNPWMFLVPTPIEDGLKTQVPTAAITVGYVGRGFLIVAWIVWVVVGFKESVRWGFCLMLIPLSWFLFLCYHWERSKKPFLTSVTANILLSVPYFFEAMNQRNW